MAKKNYDLMLTDFSMKDERVSDYIDYMLNRTQSIFEWENLPETIPQRYLELYLQTKGVVCITEVNGELYCFFGGYGGELDPYYQPTIFTVANPALNFSKALKIDEDCVVGFNDPLKKGLLPMFQKYATQLAENDLSINIAQINTRAISLIVANDDGAKNSAEIFLKQMKDGKQGVIASDDFMDEGHIKVQPYAQYSNNTIKELLELETYIIGQWFNDIGINYNSNTKREKLTEDETKVNEYAIIPLIDIMLHSREELADKINKMYGTDISVHLHSAWAMEREAIENQSDELFVENGETISEEEGAVDEAEMETENEEVEGGEDAVSETEEEEDNDRKDTE